MGVALNAPPIQDLRFGRTFGRRVMRRRLLVAGAALSLAGCSLSGLIQQSATDYNAAAANYNDQVLLYTLLRARDDAPINMLALSSINGAASLQAGLGGSVSGSNLRGSSPVRGFSGTVTPAAQLSTSPTWSMASLNTQGFTLGLIQPIAPMYVYSKWNSGLDREFLLRLFVKSIRIKAGGDYVEYLNDVGSPTRLAAFNALVHSWAPQMGLRALTVLEPLGPPFDPAPVSVTSTTLDTTTGAPTRSQTSHAVNPAASAMIGAYQYLMPLDGGPFHVGNAMPAVQGRSPALQLYREYSRQVVLCVAPAALRGALPQGAADERPDPQLDELSALNEYAFAVKAAARNGAGAQAAGTSTVAQVASGSAKATTVASHATLGSNLRTDRVAAILPRTACTSDEIVLPAASEARVVALSGASFSHVEWRSIAEVIQYLGALLRPQTPLDNATWLEPAADPASPVRHFAFRLVAGDAPGFASIDYRGTRYVIGPEGDPPALRDHSLQALSLVNELISATKVSGDLPTTPSIQVLP